MEKEIEKLLISIIKISVNENIENIYQKINEINLKLNRITNKFEYLIELLNEIGEDEQKDKEDY